ncbi:MAG: hypothetical protein FWC80_05835 [Firmicutes bacterium]|nr:hypothetical protein [Bacillota bacterium]
MYCEKCGKTRDADKQACDCAVEVSETPKVVNETNYRIMNVGMLTLMAVLTLVSTITFFVSAFGNNDLGGVYGIAATYVLCMLLVAPTLKVFLDKVSCPVFKRLNLVGIIIIFAAILVQVTLYFLMTAWPAMIAN